MNEIKKKYADFLEKAVGKAPTKGDMIEIDKRMKELNQKYKKISSTNQEVSNLYDKELSVFWDKIVAYENNGSEIELMLKYVNIKPTYKILSLASGIAVFEMFLSKEFLKSGKITCIDISSKMNKIAKSKLKNFKINNVKIIKRTVEELPIKPNSQNLILGRRTGLSSGKLWKQVLKEVSRAIVKNNSSRFIYTVQQDYMNYSKKINKELDKAGLKLIKIDSFKEKDGDKIFMIITKPN